MKEQGISTNSTSTSSILTILKSIVPSLASALGDDVEVVLHDLSHPEDSIIAIAGDVTGREVGDPLTDMVLELLRCGETEEDLINYPNQTADNRKLRSSTIFVRNGGEVVGCLCINFDITKWLIAKHTIDSFCSTEPLDHETNETFVRDVGEMLISRTQEAIREEGVPVSMMQKEEKIKVVERLDKQGLFLICTLDKRK